MDNYTASVYNGSDGVSRINIVASVIKRLAFIEVVTTYSGKQHQNDEKYAKVYFNGSFNTCDLTESLKTNFILKMVVDNLEKYSNYTFRCPEEPGIYHVNDFPAIGDQYLPHHLLGTSGAWKFTIHSTASVLKSEAMTHLLTLNLYGSNV